MLSDGKANIMCRNIKTLHNFEPPTTEDEIRAAAIQFVRKISGFNKPSAVNKVAFEMAVEEIILASKKLLDALITTAPPKDRAVEREKAQERSRVRFRTSKKVLI
jgi:hypothetical protein